jgi:phosphoenolpyruvate-protein kinase (PTS system EI component)
MNMNQATISGGVAGNVEGDFNVNQTKNNLSEAAAEIQQLLEQLSQSYPTTTTSEKMKVASAAIQHIENNHTLRQRVLSALKTGAIQALGQMLNHPAATFVIAALYDWQKSQN